MCRCGQKITRKIERGTPTPVHQFYFLEIAPLKPVTFLLEKHSPLPRMGGDIFPDKNEPKEVENVPDVTLTPKKKKKQGTVKKDTVVPNKGDTLAQSKTEKSVPKTPEKAVPKTPEKQTPKMPDKPIANGAKRNLESDSSAPNSRKKRPPPTRPTLADTTEDGEHGVHSPDDFDELGSSCASEDIRKAYRRIVKHNHPDKYPEGPEKAKAHDDFCKLQEKYRQALERNAARRKWEATKSFYDARKKASWLDQDDSGDEDQTVEATEASSSTAGAPSWGQPGLVLYDRNAYIDHRRNKTLDTHLTAELSLEEVYLGTEKDMVYTRVGLCQSCRGSGVIRIGAGRVQYTMKTQHLCPKCNGAKIERREEMFRISIPPSRYTGSSIVVPGKSHRLDIPIPRGDLVVSIYEQSHPIFRRRNNDLCAYYSFEYENLLRNLTFTVYLPDGKTILHISKQGSTERKPPPAVFCIRVPGLGFVTGKGRRGALYILVCIEELFRHEEWKHDAWMLFGEEYLKDAQKNAELADYIRVVKNGEQCVNFQVL